MGATDNFRRALGIAFVALCVPVGAAAQFTVQVPFERVGPPGETVVTQIDPLDPTQTIDVTVPTGAFINPCTVEYVDVTGVSLIDSSQVIDRQGFMRVSVKVNTRGTGFGVTDDDGFLLPPLFGYTGDQSGSEYTFRENQSFVFKIPTEALTTQEFSSEFKDKLVMRGVGGGVPTWLVKAHFQIRVNKFGVVKVLLIRQTGDICRSTGHRSGE